MHTGSKRSWFWGLALAPALGQALGLGAIDAHTTQGEPFQAEVHVRMRPEEWRQWAHQSQVSASSDHMPLEVAWIASDPQNVRVRLRSSQPIAWDNTTLTVRLRTPQTTLSRRYTLKAQAAQSHTTPKVPQPRAPAEPQAVAEHVLQVATATWTAEHLLVHALAASVPQAHWGASPAATTAPRPQRPHPSPPQPLVVAPPVVVGPDWGWLAFVGGSSWGAFLGGRRRRWAGNPEPMLCLMPPETCPLDLLPQTRTPAISASV